MLYRQTDELWKLHQRADDLWNRGEFDAAAEIHKSILKSGKAAPVDYQRISFNLRRKKNLEAAEIATLAGLNRFPYDLPLMTEALYNQVTQRNWGSAILAAEEIYAEHRGSVPAGVFMTYFECLIEKGEPVAALRFLSRIDELIPEVWRTTRQVGSYSNRSDISDTYFNEKRRLNHRVRQVLDLTPDADPTLRATAMEIMLQTSVSARHQIHGKKTLVVMLSATNKYTLQKYGFDADVLFLVDVSTSYYCVPCDAMAVRIQRLVEQYRYEKVVFIGCSKGATGAMSIAAALNGLGTKAKLGALAFSPQTQIYPFNKNSNVFPSYVNLHIKLKTQPTIIPLMQKNGNLAALDYRGIDCRVVYGSANTVDDIEARRLAACEGVILVPIATKQHYTLGFFTIPADVNIDQARKRLTEVDDPDAIAMRSDNAIEEYLEQSKLHGYSLKALIA